VAQERVADADLREDVHERPLRRAAGIRNQEDAKGGQREPSPARMSEHAAPRVPQTLAIEIRVRHRNADHEHERRLDQIPETAAQPLSVLELVMHGLPETGIRSGLEVIARGGGETEAVEGKRHHDQAAVGVEGLETRGRRCRVAAQTNRFKRSVW
jgi:hypothetical protein